MPDDIEKELDVLPPADSVEEDDGSEQDLVLLDPKTVRLFHTGGSAVRMTIDGAAPPLDAARTYIRVQIARAFPLSMPDRYIGVRDAADKDIGTFATLDGMDAESRRIVDAELERRYFLPKILRVRKVTEEFGLTTWDVETDKGAREFTVQNLRDSTTNLGATRLLVTDKDGIRYEFPDTSRLDNKSLNVLQRVL